MEHKMEIRHISCNPKLEHLYMLRSDIVYCRHGGREQKLSLILPWDREMAMAGNEKAKKELNKLPLIVFVQGSGWTTPDYGPQIPQLSEIAGRGYVIAMVGHRDARDGYAFPAFLEDVKCAVRFLRKHAEEYGIDPERIGIWGSSSGGNAALLTGLTADDPRYETEEYQEYSDAVCAVAACFAPTDLVKLSEKWEHSPEVSAISAAAHRGLFSRDEAEAERQKREMSPVYQAQAGKQYPLFLLMHGTGDTRVEYEQMLSFYQKLLECGAEAQACAVDGAPHEGAFWSREVLELICEFFAGA